MGTPTLDRALADSLECLGKGETLEACLDRYPEYREPLRSLLEVARALMAHRQAALPSPRFVTRLQSKLTREARKYQKGGEARKNSG